MTQEDKQLLLTDLCGRLPYGVKCQITDTNDESFVRSGKLLEIKDIGADSKGTTFLFFNEHVPCYSDITEIKPYLRPISSMSEAEKEELRFTYSFLYSDYPFDDEEEDEDSIEGHYEPSVETFDWYNKHHFDYRGLIPKGLALEAPEGMYNEEQQ